MRRHIGRDKSLQHYNVYKAHSNSEGIKVNELCIPKAVKEEIERQNDPYVFTLSNSY